ncbi:MAG: hypothetical protein LBF22_06860 [Deltaproteobacteria bacterium]|nr:hypothetical protein [Deltaproteobacteria bacterium]
MNAPPLRARGGSISKKSSRDAIKAYSPVKKRHLELARALDCPPQVHPQVHTEFTAGSRSSPPLNPRLNGPAPR